MKYFCLGIVVVLLALTGCSKNDGQNYQIAENNGVKRCANKNNPTVKNVDIKIQELHRVSLDSLVGSFGTYDFDRDGNIYILDVQNTKIEKFSKDLRHITSFGRDGIGPGEMRGAMSLAILNDTVYVDDPSAVRMLKFDLDGNFIMNWNISSGRMPQDLTSVGEDKFLSYMYYWYQEDGFPTCEFNLTLTHKDLSTIAVMRKSINKFDPESVDWSGYFTAFKVVNARQKIYIAENSTDEYKIRVFDLSGKMTNEITKSFRRISYSEQEKKKLFPHPKQKKLNFKSSIESIQYDYKHDLLFVDSAIENQFNDSINIMSFDIFKDGVFLIRKDLDFLTDKDKMILNGNRMYILKDRIELIAYDYDVMVEE